MNDLNTEKNNELLEDLILFQHDLTSSVDRPIRTFPSECFLEYRHKELPISFKGDPYEKTVDEQTDFISYVASLKALIKDINHRSSLKASQKEYTWDRYAPEWDPIKKKWFVFNELWQKCYSTNADNIPVVYYENT